MGGPLGTPWTSPPGPSSAPSRDTLSLAPGTEREAHMPLEIHTQAWIPAGAVMLGFACDPMQSTPGFPVLHYLLEVAQTHVH